MKYTIYILLILAFLSIFYLLKALDHNLYIIACDVGQGDGLLIQKQTTQVLIDGGAGTKINNCLSKHMPFWDRKIELVVLTHPDLDHYEGLISVFREYLVGNFMSTSLTSSEESFMVLDNLIKTEKSQAVKAYAGLKLSISGLEFKVLSPALFESQESDSENDHSVVLFLKYRDFDALFTGDIETQASSDLSKYLELQNLEYLKVPHHGSKNGLSSSLLDTTKPKLSVISVGKKNRYGHPHKEILDLLNLSKTEILRTDKLGDVVVKTDGYKYNIK